MNRQGTLALVSNMVDGTVSVFTIQGKTVTPAGTVEVGGPKAGGGMGGGRGPTGFDIGVSSARKRGGYSVSSAR